MYLQVVHHRIAGGCIKANCNCCTDSKNHSMVLDGIEGFTQPQPER